MLRVWRSGVSADGGRQLVVSRHAVGMSSRTGPKKTAAPVLVYFRQIAPVRAQIPPPSDTASVTCDPAAIEEGSAVDAGTTP